MRARKSQPGVSKLGRLQRPKASTVPRKHVIGQLARVAQLMSSAVPTLMSLYRELDSAVGLLNTPVALTYPRCSSVLGRWEGTAGPSVRCFGHYRRDCAILDSDSYFIPGKHCNVARAAYILCDSSFGSSS